MGLYLWVTGGGALYGSYTIQDYSRCVGGRGGQSEVGVVRLHAKLDGGAFAGLGRVIGARAAACARRDRPGHVHTRGAYRAPTRHTRGRGPAAAGWVKVLDHNFGLGLEVLHACSPGLGPGAAGWCRAGGGVVLTVLVVVTVGACGAEGWTGCAKCSGGAWRPTWGCPPPHRWVRPE